MTTKSLLKAALKTTMTAIFTLAILTQQGGGVGADDNFIIVQSTTSTQNSGLLDHILPQFTEKSGIKVRVVAVGTGQALKNARNGDGDVLLVHAKSAEEAFVAAGYGVDRRDVMYNDFIIVGPKNDPAKIKGLRDISKALHKIMTAKSTFTSRGDDSGTHKKEMKLWAGAKIHPEANGSWYRETGSGMGATLNIAAGMNAYSLTDRGTWIAFKNKRGLEILFEGQPALFNQYGVMMVNPARHPNVKVKKARLFMDWLTGPEGQKAILSYKLQGLQLFYPNAKQGKKQS